MRAISVSDFLKPKSKEEIMQGLSSLSLDELNKELLNASLDKSSYKIELLLEAGANVNAKDTRGYTPLMWATELDNIEIVKLLLDEGANVYITSNSDWTALMMAKHRKHNDIVELLKKHEAKER